jgi:hypothetical protein
MSYRKEEIEKAKPNGMSRTLIPFKTPTLNYHTKLMKQQMNQKKS